MLTAAGDNFSLAAGVLGVATAIPLLYGWFSRRLPSARMHVLERLLVETEGLFRSALEDGLLSDDHGLELLHSQIWSLKGRIECLRVEVYSTTSYWDELNGWWNGLSSEAASFCDELKIIRAKVAERSSRERKRKGSDGRKDNFALLIYQREQISRIASSNLAPRPVLESPMFEYPMGSDTKQRTPIACAHTSSGHARSDVPSITSQLRLKGQADVRRELLLRVGRKLFGSKRSSDVSTRHTAARRPRSGHIRELIRFIRRSFVRRRSCQTTGVQNSIDVDPALFAAMQAADDKDTEWEDVEYLGTVQLTA